MHINLNDAVKAAEAGDPTRLIHAMAAHCFAVADYPAAKMRELRDRFPAAYAEACSDRYFEAARYGTLDKLLATSTNSSNAGADSKPSAIYARRAEEREARATPAPSEKAAPVTSTWDDILLSRRLGLNAAAPEPASATAAWDDVIANVNQRYFNSVASNRGHPSAENG